VSDATSERRHASCVALDGRGLLIIGPSGSGKSALALQLLALGALLVADDQCLLTLRGMKVIASCPPPLRGLIEARGLGLLHAETVEDATLVLVTDLGQTETQRLPPQRQITCLGQRLDLVFGNPSRHFPASLLRYLQSGRAE
jgi:HPr kinase/phosphorylase